MKRKTLAEYLEEKGLKLEEVQKDAQELVTHINALNKENDEAMAKALSDLTENKAEAAKLKEVEDLLHKSSEETKQQLELITKAIGELGLSVQRVATINVNPNSAKSFDKIVEDALEENKVALIEHAGSKKEDLRIQLKAATDPLLQGNGLGTVDGEVPQPFRKPDIVNQRRRESLVRNWITTANLARDADGLPAVIEWVEQQNIEETTGPTAEGSLKNDMHWEYIVRSEKSKCITVTTVVSTHMLRRVGQMAQRINNELGRSMDNELEQQIYFGDGIGENLNGIFTQGSAFAAGTLAGTIPNANNYDVLRAAINQCMIGSSGTINGVGEPAGFFPSVIIVNDVAATSMDLSKGSDGHYIEAPFASADGTVIKNIPVITTNHLGADQFLVMEGALVEFWTEMDMFIEVGLVDDQFKKNLRTVLAEMCGLLIIPQNYVNGIVVGDFATAKAALETP